VFSVMPRFRGQTIPAEYPISEWPRSVRRDRE
jgi:hypothetical protein